MAVKQNWKALLDQHDALVKSSNATIYDRVTLLKRVYEDPDYVKEMRSTGKSPTELLDSCTSDTCANFVELYQMLKLFPKRAQWQGGNLNEMRLKMMEHLRAKQNKTKKSNGKQKPKRVRHAATLAELRQSQEEAKETKTELEHLRDIVKEKDKIIANLEASLQAARETIGSLNETISLMKMRMTSHARVTKQKTKAAQSTKAKGSRTKAAAS